MEAIKTYLETMFSALPKTEESAKLKNEFLISMEEKYNELKASGKSENEAIGTVISEFGNIDELVEETGLSSPKPGDEKITVDLASAQEFLSEGKKTAFKTALGVVIIIIGVAIMIGILSFGEPVSAGDENASGLTRIGEIFSDVGNAVADGVTDVAGARLVAAGITVLFLFVAAAVMLLVPTWLKFSKYNYTDLTKEIFLPEHVKQYVNNYKNEFLPKKITLTVAGVMICVLSVLAVILPALLFPEYVLLGTALFLTIAAFGIFLLIIMGVTEIIINALLRPEDYVKAAKAESKTEKIVSVTAAFYWPVIVALYLLFSFVWNSWGISWIIWPVAGLIFGAFAGAVGAYYDIDANKK